MVTFKKLGIEEPVLKAIQQEGFSEPTQIQEDSIPLVLEGRDVVGASKTGSGKTLAFATGIIRSCVPGQGVQALVMTPTRELAQQVDEDIRIFSKFKNLRTALVYGGVGLGPQMDAMKKADVVVGTPGRVLDHLGRRSLNLSKVKVLVLDEADRMLDMGFIDDVSRIIKECPRDRQTLMFTATLSTDIDRLAKDYMRNPAEISVESYVDATQLTQIYYDVRDNLKFSLLVHLLKNEKSGLVMVFCNTRRNTDFIARNLKNQGIDALAVHGGLTQSKREQVMDKFHSGKTFVLVCTDVAARGLDIEGVSHVYNYDIPRDEKQYTHRIGRTARAGKEGKAINILSSRDHDNFRKILRYTSHDIQEEEIPYVEQVPLQKGPPGRGKGRSRGGHRQGKRDKRRKGRKGGRR